MSDPIDEVQNTAWGQQVTSDLRLIKDAITRFDRHIESDERTHRELDVSIERISNRLDASEKDRGTLHLQLSNIERNTQTIISLSKAARAFKQFLIWATPVVSSVITAYVTWQLKK